MNLGTMLAGVVLFFMAAAPPRWVFLVGIFRPCSSCGSARPFPSPKNGMPLSGVRKGLNHVSATCSAARTLKVTLLTVAVCALSLSGHWAFIFWSSQFLRNLPEVAGWTDARAQ